MPFTVLYCIRGDDHVHQLTHRATRDKAYQAIKDAMDSRPGQKDPDDYEFDVYRDRVYLVPPNGILEEVTLDALRLEYKPTTSK